MQMKWCVLVAFIVATIALSLSLMAALFASAALDIFEGFGFTGMASVLVVNACYSFLSWKRRRWRSLIPLGTSLATFCAVLAVARHYGPNLSMFRLRENILSYEQIADDLQAQGNLSRSRYELVSDGPMGLRRYKLPASQRQLAPLGVLVTRASNSVLTVNLPLSIGFGNRKGYMYRPDGNFALGLECEGVFWVLTEMTNWCFYIESGSRLEGGLVSTHEAGGSGLKRVYVSLNRK